MSRRPTYEKVGGVTRFDERDTVFAREAFTSGSPEEREYHERHPGKIGIDRELARFIAAKMEGGPGVDIVARAIYEAHFIPVSALALPDRVDGEPSPERIEWEPAEAARRIKGFGRALGADDVRIGPLRPEWVYSHRGARPFYDGD
ncbi:MAG TPA: hypothetical protein ENO23_05005, partial [Alphaproteobacteria bacterium]|nr:hypothetical protein [Alphaproteobacteria bacterium]